MDIEEMMYDVLADANYSSAYWCNGCSAKKDGEPYKGKGFSVEEKWMNCLKEGGVLEVLDDDGEYHTITLESLRKAMDKMLKGKKEFPDWWDGTSADAVFQIASMGEVVYG